MDIERIRAAIKGLDRTKARELARTIGVDRDTLEDFSLGTDCIEGASFDTLLDWYANVELRTALTHPRNMILMADATAATGIMPERITAFAEDRVDITDSEKVDLRDFIAGKYGCGFDGKWIKNATGVVIGSLHTASAAVDPEMSRRATALRVLSTLPVAELEGLAKRVPTPIQFTQRGLT